MSSHFLLSAVLFPDFFSAFGLLANAACGLAPK
jgi:hypothetical protein